MFASVRAPLSGSHRVNIDRAQGPVMFHRVTHRILNIQPLVKPNDERSGNPLRNATQGAVSASEQQLGGQFDQEVGAAGEALTSLVVRRDIREIQVADEGRWRRRRSRFLHRLQLVLVGGISSGLPVCLRHSTHRIGRDWGFCFEICFFSWVRIKLGRVIRGQSVKGSKHYGVSRMDG